jgi:hypothetical protein
MRLFERAARLAIAAVVPVFVSACAAGPDRSVTASSSASVRHAGSEDAAPGSELGFGTLANLARLSDAQSRSVSPENFTGEKGKGGAATEGTGKNAARELGQTWKVSPSVRIKAHSTFTLADINSSGCITHIWMTPTGNWRHEIIRFYWDGETDPSVEAPVGDFFACGLGQYAQVSTAPVCVNPGSAFNCYWPMPFRKSAKVTLENIDDKDMVLYYQVDYAQTKVPADAAYLHAQFRMESPVTKTKGLYTLLDGVKGRGQYVGTYMTYQTHGSGWWGEGEMKFYLDGDSEFPTICTTGTEDYFCGSYDFEDRKAHRYVPFGTPYTGLVQVIPPDKVYVPEQKFGLYRWHITDPVRFNSDLKVQIQDLGWQSGGRYKQLEDSISTVSFWYQTLPHAPFPQLPAREELDK